AAPHPASRRRSCLRLLSRCSSRDDSDFHWLISWMCARTRDRSPNGLAGGGAIRPKGYDQVKRSAPRPPRKSRPPESQAPHRCEAHPACCHVSCWPAVTCDVRGVMRSAPPPLWVPPKGPPMPPPLRITAQQRCFQARENSGSAAKRL